MLERIRDAEPDERVRTAVISSLPSVTGDSELAVFAVPDIPAYGEEFRDRYLRLLNLVTGLRPLLLWRPVAALLGRVADAPQQFHHGQEVAVLSLMADGIHLSMLSLESHDDGSLLVPQRDRSGQRTGASFRGEVLVEDARSRLVRQTNLSAEDIEASAMSPWLFAVGKERRPELVRLAGNRGWLKLPGLDHRPPLPDSLDLQNELLDTLRAARALLIEGPFAGNRQWCDGVKAALTARVDLPDFIETADSSTVARGCLEAARRYRCDQPIYFDFLPQLEINALVDDEPQFVDLIRSGERCPGGETFVAHAPGDYRINQGATHLTFWLFKEDSDCARKAEASLPGRADQSYDLDVIVRQTPGQGFAQVQISSSDFDELRRHPITLDWEGMENDDRCRDDILKELGEQTQSGRGWRKTDVKPGHPFLWLDVHPKGNLMEQLAAYRAAPLIQKGRVDRDVTASLETLRGRFSRLERPSFIAPRMGLAVEEDESFRPLDSNGALPEPASGIQIPRGAEEELDETLSKCDNDLVVLQQRFGEQIDTPILGHIVGFASWCFVRCPPGIAEVLLGTYEGKYKYKIHHILLSEGVARVISKPCQMERYFGAVEIRLARKGNLTTSDYAGVARVLSTHENAAVILPSVLADRLRVEAVRDIDCENSKGMDAAYKRRFKSALLMLAVLLRHRQKRQGFLDPGSEQGKKLLSLLHTAKQRNLKFGKKGLQRASRVSGATRKDRRFDDNAKLIHEIAEYILLRGRDPNFIVRIRRWIDDDE